MSVINVAQRSAVVHQFTPGRVTGVEKTYPGREGTTTSNASLGSPPNDSGSDNGRMTALKSQKVHGHPWLRINGNGLGPTPRSRMKWIGRSWMRTLKCENVFMACSCWRQSKPSIQ